jgi:hypothetical protein
MIQYLRHKPTAQSTLQHSALAAIQPVGLQEEAQSTRITRKQRLFNKKMTPQPTNINNLQSCRSRYAHQTLTSSVQYRAATISPVLDELSNLQRLIPANGTTEVLILGMLNGAYRTRAHISLCVEWYGPRDVYLAVICYPSRYGVSLL